jgi:hypothetical protein
MLHSYHQTIEITLQAQVGEVIVEKVRISMKDLLLQKNVELSDLARNPLPPHHYSRPDSPPAMVLSPLAPHVHADWFSHRANRPPEQVLQPTDPLRALTGLDLLPHRVDDFGFEHVLRGRWRGRRWRDCRRGQSGAGGDGDCCGGGGGGDGD